jgi:hypothetical protein
MPTGYNIGKELFDSPNASTSTLLASNYLPFANSTPALSPNARAVCQNKECKDAGIKIQKGELRFGSLAVIYEHTSWRYKHWYVALSIHPT